MVRPIPPLVDYRSARPDEKERYGCRSARAAGICAPIAALAAIVGTSTLYHSYFLTTPSVVGGLLILLAWVLSFVGIVCGIVSVSQSRGRRGLFELILAGAVFVFSIVAPYFFPGYGLGNIH